jgi:hypothetical protein
MKYGPEKTAEISEHLRTGSNRTDACILCDISYETFTVWMQKTEFSEAIKKAEAECKNRNIKIIQKAAITTWQAAAWWLERKFQDDFALKQKIGVQIDSGERPSTDVLIQTIASLRKELNDLRKGNEVAAGK